MLRFSCVGGTGNDLLTASRVSLVARLVTTLVWKCINLCGSCGLQGATYPLLVLRRQCQISTHYTPSFGVFTPLANVGLLYRVAYNQVCIHYYHGYADHRDCYRVGGHYGKEHGIIQCMQLLNCLVMLPLSTTLRDITALEGNITYKWYTTH